MISETYMSQPLRSLYEAAVQTHLSLVNRVLAGFGQGGAQQMILEGLIAFLCILGSRLFTFHSALVGLHDPRW
jgi:hypothetical protein